MSTKNVFQIKEDGLKNQSHDAMEAAMIAGFVKDAKIWFSNPIIEEPIVVWHEGQEDYKAMDDLHAAVEAIWARIHFRYEEIRADRHDDKLRTESAVVPPISVLPMARTVLAETKMESGEHYRITMDPYGFNFERCHGGADVGFDELEQLVVYMCSSIESDVCNTLYEQLTFVVLNDDHVRRMRVQLSKLSYASIFFDKEQPGC